MAACTLWLSLLDANTRYFEWGSGFTTRTSGDIVRRVVSIEGSRDWYKHMLRTGGVKHTRLRYVDIGKTKAFSWPLNRSLGHRYIHAIDEHGMQDVVLVDGRFRVACALAAFHHLAPGGKILMHDFQRTEYHMILEFYDKEQEVDSLAVLTPKAKIDQTYFHSRLRAMSEDPR